MQLPTIDRNQQIRPAGVDAASSGANRVIPVAPVNPSVAQSKPIESGPDVIDKVNPALKAQSAGEAPYQSVSDPVQRGSEASMQHDWTIHRPSQEKVENPPPKPMAQVLMDHLKTVWTASASAVQIEQVKNQINPQPPVAPTEMPGQLAKQSMVFVPSKINKVDKT
ncbi:hypothetical protein [Rhodoferax sp. OV413]|uniref:hypothetical protein n=1 Tax=Rhodoferax sp. OV413 TaxID=1855285 RepID=UPI0025FF0FA7|nr:hypothetical protein [Rhodoferax sp. OV413]